MSATRPTASPSPPEPEGAPDVVGLLRTIFGVGSLLSMALASALAVLVTALLGPNLAMLLAMYGGNLEPTVPTTPFPWVLAFVAASPAAALAATRRFGLAAMALALEFVVCGWQVWRLMQVALSGNIDG